MTTGDGRRGAAKALALLLMAMGSSACFYDSRWGEPKRLQQSAAQRATPSAIQATPETEIGAEGASKVMRSLKIEARATSRYASEVVDWRRQLGDLLDDANAVLGPTLNLRLVLSGAELWQSQGSDDELAGRLDELAHLDRAPEVEWVVGLIGSVPRFELSFHELGMARTGHHFVVRAMNDAREYEAIEKNLSELGEDERRQLYKRRKRHKAVAVFLHELGHTLGLIHETDPRTLMHPSYDVKEAWFSIPAARLLRGALDHRLDAAAQPEPEFRRALIAQLQQPEAKWVPAERDARVAELEASLAARAPKPRPTAKPAAAPAPIDPEELAPLSPADRALFTELHADDPPADAQRAFDRAAPLFAAYPKVRPVQELRCQLAMKIGGDWDAVRKQCDALLELSKAPAKKAKP
jgi:hypothetical protein